MWWLAVSAVYQGLSGVHRELCDGPWIIHFFATLLCIRHVIGWHCLHSPEMGRGPEKGTLGRVGPGMGHVDVRLLLECSETTL